MHKILNKPKRGCGSNIGFSNRDMSKDKMQIESNKLQDINSNRPVKSDIISYNQIKNINSNNVLNKDSEVDVGLVGIINPNVQNNLVSSQININNMYD